MGALNLPSPWEGRSCTWMAKKVPTSSCSWEWPGQKWEVFLCLYLNWFHSFCIFTIWFCPMWHNREGNQNQPYLMLKKKKKLSNFWNTWYCCSVAQSYPTLGNPPDCSTPGCPVLHHLPELAQTHVHWVADAIQPSHPLFSPSSPALNLSQHQGLFKWVRSSHQVAKVLELQLQHHSFQWTPRTDLL